MFTVVACILQKAISHNNDTLRFCLYHTSETGYSQLLILTYLKDLQSESLCVARFGQTLPNLVFHVVSGVTI